MYVPDHYKAGEVDQCRALMRAHPFAILVGCDAAQGLVATHLPTLLTCEPGALGVIEAHVARPNLHWQQFAGGGEALMIFSGPHGYIHPGWFPSKSETGKVVPTWNYACVHAYGTVEIVNDEAWLHRHVAALTDQQERGQAVPWSVSDAPQEFIKVMLRGIVGLRLTITRLEGKLKMSQNKPKADRAGVVAGLRQVGGERADELGDAVARELDLSNL